MKIVQDGYGPIMGSAVGFGTLTVLSLAAGRPVLSVFFLVLAAGSVSFFVYFFRDPERTAPDDPHAILSGADGVVRAVETLEETRYLKGKAKRISIFLNPFDVHVNRTPIAGTVKGLAYTPGKHLFTISNESSEHNEHSSIYIENEQTCCLVKQIVGPVVRRVVYWLDMDQTLNAGDRIGMMKFGSRMDIYLPADDVDVVVEKGQRVSAGTTIVARVRKEQA
jgi:phosphatidylserine decarboxylase